MVADALKILGDHQQVECEFTIIRVLRDALDEVLLHAREIVVHGVVLGDDLIGKRRVVLDIGVHALGHHLDGRARHLAQELAILRAAAAEERDDLGNILGLVADALHVRDHLERRRDLAQVLCHGLLLQKKL